jgi:23S rRNA (cytosine1962-C5)-methyltransferase
MGVNFNRGAKAQYPFSMDVMDAVNLEPFKNRLLKNERHWGKWAKRQGLSAYRIYDRDIPEHRYVVEALGDFRVAYIYASKSRGGLLPVEPETLKKAVAEALSLPFSRVVVKSRNPHAWRQSQYEKQAEERETAVVSEHGVSLEVNLTDYIDTGLFLDHRATRQWVKKQARNKRLLNLFCYTGAFTVQAAAGGAKETVSVDLSNTYLDWTQRNLALNQLDDMRTHRLVRSDVLRWLKQAKGKEKPFDWIVLDPPSFSTSKKMQGTLNVLRDHHELIEDAMGLLALDGTLVFSTNYRDFELDAGGLSVFRLEELTPKFIPEDFRDKKVHRSWAIRHR